MHSPKLTTRLLVAGMVALLALPSVAYEYRVPIRGLAGPPLESGNSGPGGTPGLPASLLFAPAMLSFSTTPVGQAAVLTATLTNTGTGSASGLTLGTPGGVFSRTTTCSATLAPAASCTVTVTFAPSAIGTFSDSLTASAGAVATTLQIQGTAHVAAPEIALSATTLSFPATATDAAPATQTLTVTNTGTVPAPLTSVRVTDLATDYSVSPNAGCGASVAAGGSCEVVVTFSPTASGNRSGNLTLEFGAAVGTRTVTLAGSGQEGVATLTPATVDFDLVPEGTTVVRPVTLENTGTAPLTVSNLGWESGAAYFGQSNNCGSALAVGATCTFNLAFTPTINTPLTGSLAFSYGRGKWATVSVSGTGELASGVYSNSQVGTVMFSQPVKVGSTSTETRTFEIRNTGSGGLYVTRISTGTQNVQTNDCVSPIAPNAKCTVTVRFAPTDTEMVPESYENVEVQYKTRQSGAVMADYLSFGGIATLTDALQFSAAYGATADLGFISSPTETRSVTYTITNPHAVAFSVSVPQPTAPFTRTTTCGAQLGANSSCTVTVSFQSAATGMFNGNLYINYRPVGDSSQSSHYVRVRAYRY